MPILMETGGQTVITVGLVVELTAVPELGMPGVCTPGLKGARRFF